MKDLEIILPEYAWFGAGREDGKRQGEYNPVFYLKNRFQVIKQSTFWMSEAPDTPGSKAWDAAYPRIVTWGKIKDKFTKAVFFIFNTHFDHIGVTARINSAKILLKKIGELTEGAPLILTGDFNCTENDSPYRILISGNDRMSGLVNTQNVSKMMHYGSTGTYNGFRQEIIPGNPIDFIFVKNTGDVLRHGVIAEKWDGRFASDHYPVVTQIVIR